MQYAGPVQSGDTVVRSNQASPGITALLSKESRKQRGIFQLPPTEEPQKDFYNMALDNVQNQLRGAAQTVNAMAPEGESLAYINPQEAGILKLLGGAGEPVNATGIPSFFFGGIDTSKKKSDNYKSPRISQSLRDAMNKRSKDTPPPPPTTKPDKEGDRIADRNNVEQYIPMVAGGIGADEFKDDKNIDDNYAQQALINAYVAGAAKQAQGAAVGNVGQDALRGLSALKGQANKTFFSSDYNKMLNRAMKYGDPLTTGNYYLGSADNDLRKEGIFGDYDTEEGKRLKFGLGGGASKIGDFFSNFGLMGLLNKLFPGDEMTFDEKLKAYDNMKAQEERQRMSRDAGTADSTGEDDTGTDEDEEEEEFPYFSYRRKLMQPMDYDSIIARAYGGSEGALLQNINDAINNRDEGFIGLPFEGITPLGDNK